MPGSFVVFEGIDGSGKTTQLDLLAQRLRSIGTEFITGCVPGGTPLGQELRRLMFHTVTSHRMAPHVFDLLMLADHLQFTHTVVEPARAAGKTLLCDRSVYSQLAYNAERQGHPLIECLFKMLNIAQPDLIILLHGNNVEELLERARRRDDKQKGKAWDSAAAQAKIQNAYFDLLRRKPNVLKIDVEKKTPAQISWEIWERLPLELVRDAPPVLLDKSH